ncbi:MAG: dUTP diphosphatase [Calditrichota bacterium]
MQVPLLQLPHAQGLPLPEYASHGAAGLDLIAAVDGRYPLHPHCTAAVPTGLAIALPEGFEGQVRPRSGLALHHNIGIINSPGTIDSDYRGEIMVLLTNFGADTYYIERGDRIAQLVIARVERIDWALSDNLPPSERSEGGFGHSGR